MAAAEKVKKATANRPGVINFMVLCVWQQWFQVSGAAENDDAYCYLEYTGSRCMLWNLLFACGSLYPSLEDPSKFDGFV